MNAGQNAKSFLFSVKNGVVKTAPKLIMNDFYNGN